MKCSPDISNFLEKIFSLSHSTVFLYFSALITEEGFLISPCYSLELCIQMDIFPFLLCFWLLFFSQLFVRTPRQRFYFFAFLFHGDGLISCLLYNVTMSIVHQALYQISSLKSTSHFHCIVIRDLIWVIPQWSSSFPHFLQFKSEFGNKEFMTWATVSPWSCFCWLYRASPSLAAKNIINLISVSIIWWCPCVESSLVLLEKCVCYD